MVVDAMQIFCGIYAIVATSGNLYVGSSSDIRNRIRQHWGFFNRGAHYNTSLQAAFDKYGEGLTAFVLEECSSDALIETEQRYMDDLSPKYNQSPVAGRIEYTDEMRRKKSAALKGKPKPKSEAHRANLSRSKLGVPASAAAREKMSKTRLGVRFHSEESRAKIGAKHRGKVTSPETRAKLREAALRRFAREAQSPC